MIRAGAVDRLDDQPVRDVGIAPVADPGPFLWLQVLVVLEKRWIRLMSISGMSCQLWTRS